MAGRQNDDGYRVFRPEWKRGGKTYRAPRYHVSFKDHLGVRRRLVAFTDRSASEAFGRRVRALTDVAGVGDTPRGELARWVSGLHGNTLDRLIEWGVLDRRATVAMRLLDEHLRDWHDSIIDRGASDLHAQSLRTRAARVTDGCGFARYGDIAAIDVEQFIARKRRDGASIRTCNFYLKAAQQFCRWMVDGGRGYGLPLAALKPQMVTDEKRRRAMTADELQALITAAENAPTRGRTTGPERALIYLVAAETGLRANELRTLTKASFDLDAEEATVTVKATNSKRRREDVLPVRPELAARLRAHLAKKLPTARAFYVPTLTAKMIRADLDRAEIPVVTDAGVLDFHAVRTTFITNLARGKVHPKVAQALARHSSIELTMQTYTRLGDDEVRVGVDALPTVRLAEGA